MHRPRLTSSEPDRAGGREGGSSSSARSRVREGRSFSVGGRAHTGARGKLVRLTLSERSETVSTGSARASKTIRTRAGSLEARLRLPARPPPPRTEPRHPRPIRPRRGQARISRRHPPLANVPRPSERPQTRLHHPPCHPQTLFYPVLPRPTRCSPSPLRRHRPPRRRIPTTPPHQPTAPRLRPSWRLLRRRPPFRCSTSRRVLPRTTTRQTRSGRSLRPRPRRPRLSRHWSNRNHPPRPCLCQPTLLTSPQMTRPPSLVSPLVRLPPTSPPLPQTRKGARPPGPTRTTRTFHRSCV